MSDTKAPTQTYKASCHCGAFAYNVATASLHDATTEVVRCNCSICLRNGYLLIYVPNDQITFASGQFEDFKVRNPCPLPTPLVLPRSSHPNPLLSLFVNLKDVVNA